MGHAVFEDQRADSFTHIDALKATQALIARLSIGAQQEIRGRLRTEALQRNMAEYLDLCNGKVFSTDDDRFIRMGTDQDYHNAHLGLMRAVDWSAPVLPQDVPENAPTVY